MYIRSRYTLLATLAATTLAAGAAHAMEGSTMPLGAPAAPPPGFVALCESDPAECLGQDAAAPTLVSVSAWAGRARWAAVFDAAGIATAPSAPPGQVSASHDAPAKPRLDSIAVRRDKDQARKAAPMPLDLKIKPAPAPRAEAEPEARPSAATPTLRLLRTVNGRVNRAIRRSTDMETFGRPDVWAAPTEPGARGDCEDYVLAKRRALIEAGADPALMSIALVRTRWGETHAVLLVDVGGEEFVLDNLSPWVVRWDQAPYAWLERQVPGSPFAWVRAA